MRFPVTAGHFSPKLLLRENGLEVAPEDGEDNGLHTVGIELRLETRKRSPFRPSFSTMDRATSVYDLFSALVCFTVFTTRTLLETVSETSALIQPRNALRHKRPQVVVAFGMSLSK